MKDIFEALMLISFGVAWPASIYRSWVSRTTKGKSLIFMCVVLFGYICGIINNFLNGIDYVLVFYILDFALVTVDLSIYFRNKKLEQVAETN